jgi:transglutaminase-like putative cysteine protease
MTGNGLRLRVRHRTELAYAGQARESVNEARLLPVDGPRTAVASAELHVDPGAPVHTHRDVYGNTVAWFQVPEPHERLVVDARCTVLSHDQAPFAGDADAAGGWEELADPAVRDAHAEFLMRTPHAAWGPRVAALADVLPSPHGMGVGEWVEETIQAVHLAVAYTPGATLVDTPVEVVASERRGVCQDLAHLAIALFRRQGVPARYVSGWLHDPARGAPGESHAWVEAFVPGAGWREVDPTHPEPITARWVRVATGRDYADVPPLRGTYQGDATERMAVTVETEEDQQA